MTPAEIAAAVYESEPCARTFKEDLEAHLVGGGVVYSSPSVFFMIRPVWRQWGYQRLTNPWDVAPDGDCWWVYLLAGDWRGHLHMIPDKRPFLGFERNNHPRFVFLERFVKKSLLAQGAVGIFGSSSDILWTPSADPTSTRA